MAIISTHNCYNHYKLVNHGKLFSCDGCKMNGFGENYACGLCDNKLHKECRYPKTSITHEYFEASNFKFLSEPFTEFNTNNNRKEYTKCCDACGKDVCGFSYHCETEKLDLHPCCHNLEKKLHMDNMIFNLKAKVNSKCAWCKKTKINGGKKVPGWSYVSSCKKYHFHVYCMNEMVQETLMKFGSSAIEEVDLKKLIKSTKCRGGGSKIIDIIKSFLKIILAAFLGDPTMLISNVLVELVARSV